MAEGDLQSALERIARALVRLEKIEPADAPRSGLAESYALLDERHGLLRLRVEESIEKLDALIGRTEGMSA